MTIKNFQMKLLNTENKDLFIIQSDNYILSLVKRSYDFNLSIKLKSLEIDEKLFTYKN